MKCYYVIRLQQYIIMTQSKRAIFRTMQYKQCCLWRKLCLRFCCLGFFAHAASYAHAEDFLTEIVPGVFAHIGSHHPVDHHDRDDIANLGVIVGSRCVAVIDSGGSVVAGKQLRAAIAYITNVPICYVINTHIHFDHLLGNFAFRADTPQFIGHAELPRAVASSRGYFVEHFAKELGGKDPNLVIAPDLQVEIGKPLSLDLGDRVIVLHAFPPAHSYGDLVVFDKASSVLFTGDLIFEKRLPALDGKLLGWIDSIDTIRHWEPIPKIIVPGHGRIETDREDLLRPIYQYLTSLRDEVRQAIQEGRDLLSLEGVGESESPNWLFFDYQHPINRAKAYRELEWE